MQRDILWILIFIILYLSINFLITFFYTFFPESFEAFILLFEWFPYILNFTILFIIQQIFVTFFLFVWFYVWKRLPLRQLINFVYKFYQEQIVWISFGSLIWNTIWMYMIYLLISWTLLAIISLLNIQIPWFFGQQEVAEILWGIPTRYIYEYIIIFLIVTILWPLIEEIIYRWFITKIFLSKYTPAIWICLSAFIFALIHFERQVIGNIFILGCILWYIYYKTKSLIYAFAFHFLVNLIAVSMLFFWPYIEEQLEIYEEHLEENLQIDEKYLEKEQTAQE